MAFSPTVLLCFAIIRRSCAIRPSASGPFAPAGKSADWPETAPEPFSWANANLMPSWRAYFSCSAGKGCLAHCRGRRRSAPRAGAASVLARKNASSATRAPSAQYSHVAGRGVEMPVKRPSNCPPVAGPGSGRGCPARTDGLPKRGQSEASPMCSVVKMPQSD